jgi:hypothetical protein
MLDNSDSYPLSRHGRAPYPVMAGLDPAIRRGTSLRQMADWVAGCDEWAATNEKWYERLEIGCEHNASYARDRTQAP